jgi:hypothetical protein
MDTIRRYELRSLYHLPEQQKLWGWFVTHPATVGGLQRRWSTRTWCWWAHVGKTITVRDQGRSGHSHISNLESRKKRNGYTQITTAQLMEMWPSFLEDMDQRMLFELLANGD